MTTCSPPWPSHQLTLTPLGIRRNMSRVAHNPGTTAAGMQCICVADLCMRACTSPRVPPPPGSAIARTMLCDRFVYGQPGTAAKHGLILLPHELDLQRQEFEGWDGGAVVNPTAANNRGPISRYSRILRRSKPKPPRPKLAQPLWVCQTSTALLAILHFLDVRRVARAGKWEVLPGGYGQGSAASLGQRIDGGCVSSEQQPKRLMTYEPFRGNAGVIDFSLSLSIRSAVHEDRCQIYNTAKHASRLIKPWEVRREHSILAACPAYCCTTAVYLPATPVRAAAAAARTVTCLYPSRPGANTVGTLAALGLASSFIAAAAASSSCCCCCCLRPLAAATVGALGLARSACDPVLSCLRCLGCCASWRPRGKERGLDATSRRLRSGRIHPSGTESGR